MTVRDRGRSRPASITAEQVLDSYELLSLTLKDFVLAGQELNKDRSSDYLARQAIRCLIVCIDAAATTCKTLLAYGFEQKRIPSLSSKARKFLEDPKTSFEDSAFLPASIASGLTDRISSPDKNDERWKALMGLAKHRHAVVHPKTVQEFRLNLNLQPIGDLMAQTTEWLLHVTTPAIGALNDLVKEPSR